MKTRNLMIAAVFLTAGSFTMESLAQENIKALFKKCENMDVIDANIVRNKSSNSNVISITYSNPISDPSRTDTRNTLNRSPQSIINMRLKYTPELEKELVAAFRKDQEKATQEVEQRKDGKVTRMLYQFDGSEYSFTIVNDTINIQATEGRPNIPTYTTVRATTSPLLNENTLRMLRQLSDQKYLDSLSQNDREVLLKYFPLSDNK